jgi:hypothetical protein
MDAAAWLQKAAEYDALGNEARKKASELRHAELLATPLNDRLIYAAYARCTCGFGLAYDPAGPGDDVFKLPSAWQCAGTILGTADARVSHDRFSFATYEIKSEKQPSAHGATTREFKAPAPAE